MKQYELMIITNSSLGQDGATGVVNQIKDMITSKGGKILNSDDWGKRKFAYPIEHDTEGYYEVISFEADPSFIPDFKTKLNYINGLTRYLVTTA